MAYKIDYDKFLIKNTSNEERKGYVDFAIAINRMDGVNLLTKLNDCFKSI